MRAQISGIVRGLGTGVVLLAANIACCSTMARAIWCKKTSQPTNE